MRLDTAQLALLQITVHTQNALLERLIKARDDEGVIDFEECIDYSDKSRNDALLALLLLFQRKLEEEMTRKRTLAVQKKKQQKEKPIVRPLTPAEEEQSEANTTEGSSNRPQIESKKPKGLARMFRKSTSDQNELLPITASNRESVESTPVRLAQEYRRSIGHLSRPLEIADRGSVSSQWSKSSASKSSAATSSLDDGMTENSWQPYMSQLPTLAGLSSMGPTSKYGGSCKYAHQIRDLGPSSGLSRQSVGYYNEQIIYACKSSECKFRVAAAKTKTGYQIDNSVHHSQGLKFRMIFLAKSHVALDHVSNKYPFICLVCIILSKPSSIYHGHDELFLHIMGHRAHTLRDTPLEGPLVFNNDRVIVYPEFDIELPKLSAKLQDELPYENPRVSFESSESLRNLEYQENPWTSSDSLESTQKPKKGGRENPWVSLDSSESTRKPNMGGQDELPYEKPSGFLAHSHFSKISPQVAANTGKDNQEAQVSLHTASPSLDADEHQTDHDQIDREAQASTSKSSLPVPEAALPLGDNVDYINQEVQAPMLESDLQVVEVLPSLDADKKQPKQEQAHREAQASRSKGSPPIASTPPSLNANPDSVNRESALWMSSAIDVAMNLSIATLNLFDWPEQISPGHRRLAFQCVSEPSHIIVTR
jgi:hypothetical protein